jgi:hypothetical protein
VLIECSELQLAINEQLERVCAFDQHDALQQTFLGVK